jgi:hypothetical protein
MWGETGQRTTPIIRHCVTQHSLLYHFLYFDKHFEIAVIAVIQQHNKFNYNALGG